MRLAPVPAWPLPSMRRRRIRVRIRGADTQRNTAPAGRDARCIGHCRPPEYASGQCAGLPGRGGALAFQSPRCHTTWLPGPCWGCGRCIQRHHRRLSGSLPVGAALASRRTGGNGWPGHRAACLVRTLLCWWWCLSHRGAYVEGLWCVLARGGSCCACFSARCHRAGHAGWPLAPLLLVGAAASALFAGAVNAIWPDLLQKSDFAVVRMAAFFTAVVRTPITGIILVAEMTERADLALPLLVASLGAIVTSTALGSEPIYDTLRSRMPANDRLK